MSSETRGEVTGLLSRVADGDSAAREALLPLVYDQLLAMAHALFRGQPAHHTLQPTALVHEAWLKLLGRDAPLEVNSRAHFGAVAATAMRQVLVDHARKRSAARRAPPGDHRVTLSRAAAEGPDEVEVLTLNAALARLSALSERQARVVELRFFGGLTVEETATALSISERTARNEWRRARAWLNRELAR